MYRADPGERLRYVMFGANDGLVTTFTVIAGVLGAHLPAQIILIIGVTKLFSDGFSMAASNYLGEKTEHDFAAHRAGKLKEHVLDRHLHALLAGLVTFLAFVVVGATPLLPYFFGLPDVLAFRVSAALAGMVLFLMGALRSTFMKRPWFFAGLEMFLAGGLAAILAYFLGAWLRSLVGISL